MPDCCRRTWLRADIATRATAATHPGAREIADTTVALWFDIAAALEIIIGREGFIALYNRGAALAAQKHPWLGAARAGDDLVAVFAGLQAMIAEQGDENADLGAAELLQTFSRLLAGLVGAPLCARILALVIEQRSHES